MKKKHTLEVQEDFVDGTSDYYITLPDQLCYDLEWYPGDQLVFQIQGDEVVISKKGA